MKTLYQTRIFRVHVVFVIFTSNKFPCTYFLYSYTINGNILVLCTIDSDIRDGNQE